MNYKNKVRIRSWNINEKKWQNPVLKLQILKLEFGYRFFSYLLHRNQNLKYLTYLKIKIHDIGNLRLPKKIELENEEVRSPN